MTAVLTPPRPKLPIAGNKAAVAPSHPAPESGPPKPLAGETQEAFFDRANGLLQQSIPSVNRRTVEILRLWCSSLNDQDLRDKASLRFTEDKFVHLAPRCVFLEHVIPGVPELRDASGNVVQRARPAIVYDRDALLKLVQWANYRIRNSESFSVLSNGHTPSEEEKSNGCPMPDVLGYCGPFYLGLLGDVTPQWAIYADEWHHIDDAARCEKLQRRSPEVWVIEPIERRTMDPIAALGAETPRLDSGMNPYCRAGDGQRVMRYSAMAFPGPHNTHVPGGKSGAVQYSGESPMGPLNSPANPSVPQVDPQAIASAIGIAIQGLMPSIIQAVMQQMGAGGSSDVPDDQEGALGDTGATPTVPRGVEGDQTDQGDGTVPAAGTSPAAPPPAATTPATTPAQPVNQDGLSPDEQRQYSAMSPECQSAYQAGFQKGRTTVKQNYARGSAGEEDDGGSLHAVVARQQTQIEELRAELRQKDTDTMRYSKLHEKAQAYAFDVQEEFETCADMTDEQFERHISVTVAKYAKRDDESAVELYDDPTLQVDRYSRGSPSGGQNEKVKLIEKYSRQAASTAAEKNFRKPGSTSYEDELNALLKQHGLAV